MQSIVEIFIFVICVAITFASDNAYNSPPTSDFKQHATLDSDGKYQLFWSAAADKINFQYHAATKGWAALGFSPNGGMGGADIVLFWIDSSGKGVISDRHADQNGFPPEDAQQDYTLTSAVKNDTHLVVTFSRKINTCDKDDWPLTEDTTRVIYAANDVVPKDKDNFNKHTVKGTKGVFFFDVRIGVEKELPEKDAKPMDLRVNQVHVPDNVSTTYWCEFFKLPLTGKKLHIVKIEPVIQSENTDVVHHIVVYVCKENMTEYMGSGRVCFAEDGSTEQNPFIAKCSQQVIAVWAVGGQGGTYPDNIGMPLYSDGEAMFVMMEMHYDNSQFKKGKVDNSGMRIWVTETLRPIEAGQILLGIPVQADEQMIPPGVKEFTNYAYCSAECTQNLPKDGIKVMGGLMHTHLAGRKVRLLHFRNGKQLPNIMSDEHYDFNYQDNRRLSEPVTVLPGDELVTECVYDTTDRSTTTFSGHGTHDEMCVLFVDYYPAAYKGFVCFSSVDKRELFNTLAVPFVPYNESDPGNNNVTLSNGQTKRLPEYLKQDFKFDWTPEKIKNFEQKSRDVKHNVMCSHGKASDVVNSSNKSENGTSKGGFSLIIQYGYPNVTEPLVNKDDVCGGNQHDEGTTANDRGTTKSSNMDVHTNVPAPTAQPLRERDKNNASRVYDQFLLCTTIFLIILTFIRH